MSIFQFFKNDVEKNRICDDKKILCSGDQKNNFHFVTIIFFKILKKIFSNKINGNIKQQKWSKNEEK